MNKFEYDPEKILDVIIKIEEKFPVNEWKINDVQFWPFIRTSLAYTQRLVLKPAIKGNSKNNYAKVLLDYGKTLFILPVHIFNFIRNLKLCERIFVGANTHRINIDGKLYNKYFDAAIGDFDKHGSESIILDRGTSLKKSYYPNNDKWFSLPSLYVWCEVLKRLGFRKKQIYRIELPAYDDFYRYLISNFRNVESLKSGFNEGAIRRKMINFQDRKELLKGILKKSKTKKAYFLCYYTSLFYPLIAACNELNIDTIDVQHGGMGKGHWSYDQWSVIPTDGYILLPRYFWTWDNHSSTLINNWASNTDFHRAIRMGTPWLNDYSNVSRHSPNATDYILFNMTDVVLENYVVEAIKRLGAQQRWVLRMHPRMFSKRDQLERQVAEQGLKNIVSIEDSRFVLLADSLQFCSAFISASSGSIIEAIQAGLTPVLLPSPGFNYYEEYIRSGEILSLPEKNAENLTVLLNRIMANKENVTRRKTRPYENKFIEFERSLTELQYKTSVTGNA